MLYDIYMKNNSYETFWDRVLVLIRDHKMTLKGVCAQLNLNYMTIYSQARRKGNPDFAFIQGISELFGISLEEMMTPEPDMNPDDKEVSLQKLKDGLKRKEEYAVGDEELKYQFSIGQGDYGGMIMIPFVPQKFACGKGRISLDENDLDIRVIAVMKTVTRGFPGNSRFWAAPVEGDSMKNAGICDGDIVVIAADQIAGDGIYAFVLRGELMVKRLQFNPYEDTVSVISDNPAYAPFKVPRYDDDLVILGKVAGWFHGET